MNSSRKLNGLEDSHGVKLCHIPYGIALLALFLGGEFLKKKKLFLSKSYNFANILPAILIDRFSLLWIPVWPRLLARVDWVVPKAPDFLPGVTSPLLHLKIIASSRGGRDETFIDIRPQMLLVTHAIVALNGGYIYQNTRFQRHKRLQTKKYLTLDTIIWFSFEMPFLTWCRLVLECMIMKLLRDILLSMT